MSFIKRLIIFTAFCITLVVRANGQEMKLIDAVEHFNCEDLLARLDYFSIHVANNSTPSVGQIILFPGLKPIENAKHENYLRQYVVRRKLEDKVFVATAEAKEKLRIEFWSGPTGAERPFQVRKLTRKLPTSATPILFDSDLFEMFVDKRKVTFVGVSCSACCISNLDWRLLGEFLDANLELIPYVVIRGSASRHRALRSELERDMREAGFTVKKIRYVFASKNLINTSHFSEVAIFLSPNEFRSANGLRSDFECQH